MDRADEVVVRAIDKAQTTTHESLKKIQLAEHGVAEGAAAIRKILRGLLPRKTKHWCNYSHDVPLLHHLIVAPPTIVELTPVPEAKFEAVYGLTIGEMETLVKAGVVIPHIYERDPLTWAESPNSAGYRTLLQSAIANGAITDTYFGERQCARGGQSFDDMVLACRDASMRSLARLSAPQRLYLADRFGMRLQVNEPTDGAILRSMSRAIGSNWAYLEAMAPANISESVTELLSSNNSKDVINGAAAARILKHEYASPITGALGGFHIWPAYSRDICASLPSPDRTLDERIMCALRDKSNVLEYVNLRLRRAQPYIKVSNASDLIAIFSSNNWRDRSRRIWDLYETIGALVSEGHLRDADVTELENLYVDMSSQIRAESRHIEFAVGAAALATDLALQQHPLLSALCEGAALFLPYARVGEWAAELLKSTQTNSRSLFFGQTAAIQRISTRRRRLTPMRFR